VKPRELQWVEERDVLAIHERLIALHGGAKGLRDRALLQSAIARPRQHYSYGSFPDVIELGAIYTSGLIQNHPFVDGNKRVGFVVGTLFIEINGFEVTASEESATHAVFDLASGKLDEVNYTLWLRSNSRARRRKTTK